MIKDFLSLRNLVTMVIISSTVMFILSFYSLIVYDDLSTQSIIQIVFGAFFAYFSLFGNEALSKRKKVARSSYLSINIASSAAFAFFIYLLLDSVLLKNSSLDIQDSLSIRAHAEVVFVIIGTLSLLMASVISGVLVYRKGDEL